MRLRRVAARITIAFAQLQRTLRISYEALNTTDREGVMLFALTIAFTAAAAALCTGGWIASVTPHKRSRVLAPRR